MILEATNNISAPPRLSKGKYNVSSIKSLLKIGKTKYTERKMRTYIKFKSNIYPEENLTLKDGTARKALYKTTNKRT